MATETANSKTHSLRHGCWSCQAQVEAHFCDSCGKVQPAEPVDYFRFFGLPRKLELNVKELERDFYRLSRQLHPDKYARVSDRERQWALSRAVTVNDAYRTLRDPIARTEYLLKLESVDLEEQSKSATEKARATGEVKKQVVPPELQEEVFELNMQLEEARMNKKMGETDDNVSRDLQQAKTSLEGKYGALDQELRGHWNEWDALIESGSSEAERKPVRDKMVDVLNRRKYVQHLVRDVNEVLE